MSGRGRRVAAFRDKYATLLEARYRVALLRGTPRPYPWRTWQKIAAAQARVDRLEAELLGPAPPGVTLVRGDDVP